MAKRNASFFQDTAEVEEIINDSLEMQDDEIPEDEYVPPRPVIQEPTRQGRPMVVREHRVDTLTIVRKRVPLTKSMCRKQGCSYDAAKDLGYPAYKNVPPELRDRAKSMLEHHVQFAHSTNDAHIVFESDMQREWLGVDLDGNPRRI